MEMILLYTWGQNNSNAPLTKTKVTESKSGTKKTVTTTEYQDGSFIITETTVTKDGDKTEKEYYVSVDGKATLIKCDTDAKTVTLPSYVKVNGKKKTVIAIGAKAFYKNLTTEKIIIKSNIEIIGKNAFAKSKVLKTIVIYSGAINAVEKGAFNKISKDAKVKIKAATSEYKRIAGLITGSGISKKIKIRRVK